MFYRCGVVGSTSRVRHYIKVDKSDSANKKIDWSQSVNEAVRYRTWPEAVEALVSVLEALIQSGTAEGYLYFAEVVSDENIMSREHQVESTNLRRTLRALGEK